MPFIAFFQFRALSENMRFMRVYSLTNFLFFQLSSLKLEYISWDVTISSEIKFVQLI